ncbi:ATP-dependent RecD-like DNA helicase [Prevotella sp. HJM029]|uniref:ATP-dependent DNA helicase n=1 Tax=Prevotella sp. HJM029 TaxID=1433844 RepID=UPI00048FA4E2|nr:AAA family ATPase [Prevotella sp. HJM029]
MSIQEFIDAIVHEFGFTPTRDQLHALDTFAHFLADRADNCVMILRGSAGTGKTLLGSAMVKTFLRMGQKLLLLAPTGRAAKVFSVNSGQPAGTIHRKIYRERQYVGLEGEFNLAENKHKNTLFIVDEASMIGTHSNGSFGSGDLLADLIAYVYQGDNCHLLLIGDGAQLPPIGESDAPALQCDVLEGKGLKVYECSLKEVLRQSQDSGILYNATQIRALIASDEAAVPPALNIFPRIHFKGFADVVRVSGADLIETLSDSYRQVGEDETMVVTRSNKRANQFNEGIRGQVLEREEELSSGDLLMVVKNKYLTTPVGDKGEFSFIANGDRAKVLRVRNVHECHGFLFADVWLQFPDYNQLELQQRVILDTLTAESPALSSEQQERLYESVMADYADIPRKRDRIEKLKGDPYFNALQIKYAYAVTCHKAQGGQWAHVYIDQGYVTEDMLTPDYIHWLYTAFTRATEKLFLVNWPKQQIADGADDDD